MIYVTAVHMGSDGETHQHIAEVMWLDSRNGVAGKSKLQDMIGFLDGGDVAEVAGRPAPARIGVNGQTERWLQTHADGAWTDTLLALPRY